MKFTASKFEKAKQLARHKKDNTSIIKKTTKRRKKGGNVCIFCDENCDSGNLHEFRSLVVEQKAQESTKKLEDSLLLAKISGGDLLAIEAKYHIDSLTKFRNKYCLVRQRKKVLMMIQ